MFGIPFYEKAIPFDVPYHQWRNHAPLTWRLEMKNSVTVGATPETKKTERLMALSVVIPVVGTFLAFDMNNLLCWENFPLVVKSSLAVAGLRLFWRIFYQDGVKDVDHLVGDCVYGWMATLLSIALMAVVVTAIGHAAQWEWVLWLTPWVMTWFAYQWKRRSFTVLLFPMREEGRIPFYKIRGEENIPRALMLGGGTTLERGMLGETGAIPMHYEVELPRHGDRIHKTPLLLEVSIVGVEHETPILSYDSLQRELESLVSRTLVNKEDPEAEGERKTFAHTLPRNLYLEGEEADRALGRFIKALPRQVDRIPLLWGHAHEK